MELKPEESQMVALVGLPGAGKTTVSMRLSAEFGWSRLSTGEALRGLASRDSELSARLASGELGPEAVVAEIVQRFLAGVKIRRVMDGYPRHRAQAEWLRINCSQLRVIHLVVPRSVATERLLNRREPGGRPEDNPVGIERRLDEAERDLDAMFPVIRGCVTELEASGPEQVVFKAALNALKMRVT
jgi:adenylate kinase family enzyme